MELTDANYEPCCRMLSKGATTAAVCTQIASSVVAAGTTCPQTDVATTDSTSYSKPTSYSTAPNRSPVEPTPKPTTSGIEGQAISSQAVITEWTTTTVSASCEPTAVASDTCECSDSYATPTSSPALVTSGIEGQSISSEPAVTTSSTPAEGNWAGRSNLLIGHQVQG